eukprot:scaffold23914_cov58-Phaeocystis_antarctica.AAC.1
MLSPNKCLPEATMAKGKPAHPALLTLLCSAALVLGAWPWVGASIVSLVSGPPPQPLSAWQCNAQDGSLTQGGVITLPDHLEVTFYLEMIWLYVLHSALGADWTAAMVDRKQAVPFLYHIAEARVVGANSEGLAADHVEEQPVACPPQWLPVLLASSSLSLPLMNCTDKPNLYPFALGLGFPDGDCSTVIPQTEATFGFPPDAVCASTAAV